MERRDGKKRSPDFFAIRIKVFKLGSLYISTSVWVLAHSKRWSEYDFQHFLCVKIIKSKNMDSKLSKKSFFSFHQNAGQGFYS